MDSKETEEEWNLYDIALNCFALKKNQPSEKAALEEGEPLIRYWAKHGQKKRYRAMMVSTRLKKEI